MALQHDTSTDLTSIDIAGQVFRDSDSRSVQLNIKSGEFLLNTHKSYVAFQLDCTGCYAPDFSALVQPIHMRLGPIEVPYSNGHYYKSQWMHTLSKEQLSEQKYGLGIATGGSF